MVVVMREPQVRQFPDSRKDSAKASSRSGGKGRSGGKRTPLGDVTNQRAGGKDRKPEKPAVTKPHVSQEAPRAPPPLDVDWKAKPLPSLSAIPMPAMSEEPDLSDEEEVVEEILYPGHPQYQPIDVTVKNTFIELPCTPERGTSAEATAATAPAKFGTEEERRAWEEAREAALEAQNLFAGVDRKIEQELGVADPSSSVGSLLHRAKLCKPCAWFHHPKGCQRGVRCEFCHCCPAGEIKRRKKEKTLLIRKRRAQRHDEIPQVDTSPAVAMPAVAMPVQAMPVPAPLPVQPTGTSTIFTAAHAQAQPFLPAGFPTDFDHYAPEMCGYDAPMQQEQTFDAGFAALPGFTQPLPAMAYEAECGNYGFQYWN